MFSRREQSSKTAVSPNIKRRGAVRLVTNESRSPSRMSNDLKERDDVNSHAGQPPSELVVDDEETHDDPSSDVETVEVSEDEEELAVIERIVMACQKRDAVKTTMTAPLVSMTVLTEDETGNVTEVSKTFDDDHEVTAYFEDDGQHDGHQLRDMEMNDVSDEDDKDEEMTGQEDDKQVLQECHVRRRRRPHGLIAPRINAGESSGDEDVIQVLKPVRGTGLMVPDDEDEGGATDVEDLEM